MTKEEIEQIKSNVDIVDVIGRHVSLKKSGANFKGICPFHEDDKASLTINKSKQIFKCFACGGPDGKGGDVIHFLTGLGHSFEEAILELNGGNPIVPTKIEKRESEKKKQEWFPSEVIPDEVPVMNHYKNGNPSLYWAYKTTKGDVVGYVCRFDHEDGSKDVIPFTYCTNGETSEWRWQGMKNPRILYNADLIAKYPKATILIVEGEKTADAAQKELIPEKTIATTWIGGANGINNADFTLIYGRRIIYWADNDYLQKYGAKHPKKGELKPWHEQPGNSAMLNIFEILKTKCKIHKWVEGSEDLPHKWDCADKEWKNGELRKYIQKNMIDVPKVVLQLAAPEPIKPIPQETVKAKTIATNPIDNRHYRMLGYDKDESGKLIYYFFSHDAKAVIKLSPSAMTKSNLIPIAPLNYWENAFPANKGIDMDQVQQFLIGQSHQVGIFRDKYIRGRGAWVDNDEIIVHTGDKILKEGKYIPLRSFESKFVYEIGEDLGFKYAKQLKNVDSVTIIDKMKWLLWERPVNAYLLAGWCVIAPFCGVLNWRPHVWVTGPAGSGKSWLMEKMVKALMLDSAIVVQGKTTEAGVRGMLQSDARPVLFDESDVDSQTDKERIQSILALARASSYSDGGGVVKGTQSGLSRSYTIRSCFAFSSIGMQLNQQSDRSRFTILGLRSFEAYKTKEAFAKFELDWNKTVTPEFVNKLHSRTIELLPTILENSKVFADAASHIIGNRRIGDQVGGMLAGAYSLISRKKITYDEAFQWTNSKDWTEEKGQELTKDENQLFSLIMGSMLRVEIDGSIVDRTVGELIEETNRGSKSCDNRLRRSGILVIDKIIYISNTSQSIRQMTFRTSWNSNHSRILERLEGAKKVTSRTFHAGHKSRAVSIPLSMVTDEEPAFIVQIESSETEIIDKDELPF